MPETTEEDYGRRLPSNLGKGGGGVTPHLVNFVPLWVEALLDRLALEQLVTDLQHPVRVRLALYEPPQELILPFQVQSLQEVDPQDPLQGRSVHEI